MGAKLNVSGRTVSSAAKGERLGPMAQCMKAISWKGLSKATESSNTLMVASSKANGRITKCTDSEFSSGQMAVSMTVITSMIRKKDLACTPGHTEETTQVDGTMVNSMVKAPTLGPMVKRLLWERGPKVSSSLSFDFFK